MIDAQSAIGTHDILFVTLDTLRYDVACEAMAAGETPALAALVPGGQWERRHSPASFTYAAHRAFFAGFLPTPIEPGPHERLFAMRFAGSLTTGSKTAVFDAPDIVTGLAELGYRTICIGGVGFFNKQTPLGSALPSLFAESYWNPRLGVTFYHSTREQVRLALKRAEAVPADQRAFLFINISALHHPNSASIAGCKGGQPRYTARGACLCGCGTRLPVFRAAKARSLALHPLFRSRNRLWRGRLSWPPPSPPLCLGRSLCAIHPAAGARNSMSVPLLDASPYQGYQYAYPHKTAYRALTPPVGLETFGRKRIAARSFFTSTFPSARCAAASATCFRLQARRSWPGPISRRWSGRRWRFRVALAISALPGSPSAAALPPPSGQASWTGFWLSPNRLAQIPRRSQHPLKSPPLLRTRSGSRCSKATAWTG